MRPEGHDALIRYRPDIDGLRAVAVLAVVVYHAFPAALSGGFVGVDVFFVISGYLISQIILRGLSRETFTFRGFYARRIRRIFPALFIVLAASFALGWRVLEPAALAQLGRHIVAGAGFLSNFILWSEIGYFDTDAALKPLLHLWSLGVEEQFYVVWPLLLWGLWRLRLSIVGTLAVVTAASFVVCVVLTARAPGAAFYLPMSRAWELGAGSLLACLRVRAPALTPPARLGPLGVSLPGLALIGLATFAIDAESAFPGWWALLPVLGAGLIILDDHQASIGRRLLASPPMVWIGLISYPLYLWHWVLLSFARNQFGGDLTVAMRGGAVALSFALAAATYYLVERPIRTSRLRAWTVSGLAASMTAVAAVGAVTVSYGGFSGRFPLFTNVIRTFDYDWEADARLGECWVDKADPADAYAESCLPRAAPGKPTVLVWGDSHAGRFAPGMQAAHGRSASVGSMTRSSCPPIVSYAFEECVAANEHILDIVRESPPDAVVLYAFWSYYAYDEKWLRYADGEDREAELIAAIAEMTDKIADAGVERIILMGPPVRWDGGLPRLLIRRARRDNAVPARLDSGFDPKVASLDRRMRETDWNGRVEYFSVVGALCDEEGCLTYVPSDERYPVTWDYGHLTTPGAALLARRMSFRQVRSARSDRVGGL